MNRCALEPQSYHGDSRPTENSDFISSSGNKCQEQHYLNWKWLCQLNSVITISQVIQLIPITHKTTIWYRHVIRCKSRKKWWRAQWNEIGFKQVPLLSWGPYMDALWADRWRLHNDETLSFPTVQIYGLQGLLRSLGGLWKEKGNGVETIWAWEEVEIAEIFFFW